MFHQATSRAPDQLGATARYRYRGDPARPRHEADARLLTVTAYGRRSWLPRMFYPVEAQTNYSETGAGSRPAHDLRPCRVSG